MWKSGADLDQETMTEAWYVQFVCVTGRADVGVIADAFVCLLYLREVHTRARNDSK
jgi:hypothetical protein